MKAVTCRRLFEAEAVRDGRLAGSERENFERHARFCAVCAREVAELAALGEALCRTDTKPEDELQAHREKTRLLAAFDRQLLAPRERVRGRRWFFGAAAAVALVVAGFGLARQRAHGDAMNVAPRPAIVRAESATVWSDRVEGARELIALERGTLWVQVDHQRSERKVVVTLPDGELEDIGTIFSVVVEDGRTRLVTVREGRVVLHLRARAAISLGAGEAWSRAEPAAAAAAPSSAAAPSLPAPEAVPHAPAPAVSARANDAGTEFRQATAALNRGDNAEAAKEFARFLERYPRDGRAEDAAYLRVIALERAGDRGALKNAAADFLRRYPTGFRRAEVEALFQVHSL